MSKNKTYHNYKNYSNNKPKTETEQTEETVIVENQGEKGDPGLPDPLPQLSTSTTGTVSNCQRLRVREAASVNSEVLCEILINSEVIIDNQNSTKDFYKVTTSAGIEGFCMKKFIEVK